MTSRPSLHDLGELTASRSVLEVGRRLDEILNGAELWAIDHATDAMHPVLGEPDTRPLTSQLREDLLSLRSHETEYGERWIPLPEDHQPVFVVRTGQETSLSAEEMFALGAVARSLRTRFTQLDARRRRDEMSVAAEIQWSMLPPRAHRTGPWSVGAGLEPAYDVAGDLFDIGVDDDAMHIASFDGMGHGLSATLAAIAARGAILNARWSGDSLVEQVAAASSTLYEQWGGDMFVTGVVARIDASGVEYVNAGHERVRRYTRGDVVYEELHADLPIGLERDAEYRSQTRSPVAAGDGIIAVSDGATEARNTNGDAFNNEGALDASIAERWTDAPLLTAHNILGAVLDHIDGGEVLDDVTVVVVRSEADEVARR